MQKIRTLLRAPIETQSGYGKHSLEVFRALFSDPLFDLHIEGVGWGNCSFRTDSSPEREAIKNCIKKYLISRQQENENWDLFVSVTIPSEFEKRGKINIGVTAGIETDRISHVWVQKCNEMDLVIVPSEHSKKVIEKTAIDWQNQQTGQQGTFQVDRPVIVCNEGVDTEIFKKLDKLYNNPIADMDFGCDFNFLSVSQWGKGGFGEDRKNISLMLKYFIEEFSGRKDVGLVLKTNMSRNNEGDFVAVKNRLEQIKSNFKEEDVPPIHLIHGNLTEEEMSNLYNHPQIKALVSFTAGEGYGRPLLEAAACELPVIATNWSGHLDFLPPKKFSAVEYDMVEIPEVAVWEPILIKGSRWAKVKEEDAKRRLGKMVSSYSKPKQWAKELGEEVRENFDINVVCQNLNDTIRQAILSRQGDRPNLVNPLEELQSSIDTPEDYNILYTMPMSNGDVFISTAVIDGLMKDVRKVQPGAKLYFATSEQYASILDGNPNVYKVIPWRDFMMNMDVTESLFDLVLTPNTNVQYQFSNWVRRGQGRLLAEEYANHCQVELGDYFIRTDPVEDLPEQYMTVHAGSGEGQWEARKYEDWNEVLLNLKNLYPALQVVQVGSQEDMELEGVDIDMRGKTTVHQLATVLKHSMLHAGIDSFPVHLAAAFDTPLVGIYGCSYASSTGPWVKNEKEAKYILLESERRTCGCNKACYKNKPVAGNGFSPLNELDPKTIFLSCEKLLEGYEQ